jgi:hypothetical protein
VAKFKKQTCKLIALQLSLVRGDDRAAEHQTGPAYSVNVMSRQERIDALAKFLFPTNETLAALCQYLYDAGYEDMVRSSPQ